jgi:hypothetical protein
MRRSTSRKLRIFKHGRGFRSKKIQALQYLNSTQEAIIQSLRGQLRIICEDEDDDLDNLTLDNYGEEDWYPRED